MVLACQHVPLVPMRKTSSKSAKSLKTHRYNSVTSAIAHAPNALVHRTATAMPVCKTTSTILASIYARYSAKLVSSQTVLSRMSVKCVPQAV
jgi:hypothetical protein